MSKQPDPTQSDVRVSRMAMRSLEVEGLAKRLQVIANDMGGRTPGWSPVFALERAQQQMEELVREVKRDWESAT